MILGIDPGAHDAIAVIEGEKRSVTDEGDLEQRQSLVAPPPSAAALRMRRSRKRRRRAMRCMIIELRETEITALS